MALPTKSIRGLEIFSVGRFNGDRYTTEDLDDMIDAFGQVGFQPTVKAGHQEGQENSLIAGAVFGEPSLGYVERIYRKGSKLLADIKGIPARFADLIKAGSYKRVSAEIYFDYETQDSIYPRVLKAVAFLGADIPALTSLRAVEALFRRTPTGAVYAYSGGHEFRVYHHETLRGAKTMQLNTYESDEIAALDYAAYGRGDQQAGRRIQKEIDSGTSLKDLASLSERYRRGDMAPKSAREASPKEISDAGIALHNDAVERLQARDLQHTPENYRKSFSEAMQGAPSVAATYSRGVKLDDDDDADVHSFYETGDTEMSPMVVISNLVTSIPRPPSNDIDFVTAARAVNEFVPIDIRQLAAEECLQNLSDKSGKSREEIEREHEALADAAESGEFSEEGLRELCWPLFSRDR